MTISEGKGFPRLLCNNVGVLSKLCNFLWIQRVLISLAMYLTGWVAVALWFSALVSHLPAWLHSTGAMRSFIALAWGGDLVYNVFDRITVALWFSVLVNSSDRRYTFCCFFLTSAVQWVQISHLLLLQATSMYLPKMTTHAPDDCEHGTDWCQVFNDYGHDWSGLLGPIVSFLS